jgi:hypothetical protein
MVAVGITFTVMSGGVATPATMMLITAGAGMVMSGIGTLLAGNVAGTHTTKRNPIEPWAIVYGRAKVGGCMVYVGEWGTNNQWIDMVIVLAGHPCASVDALLLDGQRLRLDANGCSFPPTQQTVHIVSISRTNDIVTIVLPYAVTDLEDGDSLIVESVTDRTLNGTFPMTVVNPTTLSYLCGGAQLASIADSGVVKTMWPNYGAKVHMEVLLGNHTATFPGMINGTPYDGDLSQTPVLNSNNPWTASCMLLGKTSAFLRLHYSAEIFANGLPTFGFRVRGRTGIYDPRAGAPGAPSTTTLARPTTLLNGWGNNAQAGPYELGQSQATNWGLNNDTTHPYSTPDNAVDGNLTSSASCVVYHDHHYTGCIWSFATLTPQALFLNVLSEIPMTASNAPVTLRSSGIWYSLDGGTTYTELYNLVSHPRGYDSVALPPTQDLGLVRVMAFSDSHDDMSHIVYDINVATTSMEAGSTVASPTAGYTENAALCIADYLANPVWGFSAAYGTEIPLPQLIAAANICDEAVPLAEGGTEPRYAMNGQFNLEMKRGEALQNMLTSCAGRLTFSAGQFVIWPAAWYGATPLALDALQQAAGPFKWKQKLAIRDLYNGVKGTFVSPVNNWEASDIPPYAQDFDHGYASGSPLYPFGDANLAADGGVRRWLDIQLPFTISVACAQRLCKIELLRRRQQGTGTFVFNMTMYQATALDVLAVNLSLLGWSEKLLEVSAHRFTMTKQQIDGNDVTLLGTEIDVQETDPSVYAWSTTDELSAAGFAAGSGTGATAGGGGGGATVASYATYSNTPAVTLAQTNSTTITLAAVSVAFPTITLLYNTRAITILAPVAPQWYYVTIADPNFYGDAGSNVPLEVFADTTPARVGVSGYTYMGAILVHPTSAGAVPLPGGWPAPQSFLVGA